MLIDIALMGEQHVFAQSMDTQALVYRPALVCDRLLCKEVGGCPTGLCCD